MNGRDLAIQILYDVIVDGQYANLAIKHRLKEVAPIDQSLVTALVYTTLQHHRTIRALWSPQVKKSPKPIVGVVLDVACAQLRYFDKLPDYAVVNESVEWMKKNRHEHSAAMVNAVLRAIIPTLHQDLHGIDAADTFALNHAIPTWLYRLWISHYGQDNADRIALSLLDHAHVSARVNTLKISMETLLKDPHLHSSALGSFSIVSDENLVHSPHVKNGEIWLQDEASAYVSEFAQAKPGMKVLDVCSAPGSKTAGLAASMNDTGEITAVELHPHRSQLIEQLMHQLDIHCVKVLTLDARELNQHLPEREFDLILADVPCSGLGVLRRKADIKLRLSPTQLDELEGLQKSILEGIHTLLKVDGTLVYSTCTLNKKENELQMKHFVKRHPEFILVEERTIFPFEVDSDGFYMAKLKRIG